MTLKFHEGTHVYRLDGKTVPSVTTIIDVLNKPGLPRWSATSVAEFVADHRDTIEHLYTLGRDPMVAALKGTPWQQAKTKADRGTALHDVAEHLLRGEDVQVPDTLVPVIENALRFLDDWQIEPILIEQLVGDRAHRFAGKLDFAGRYVHPETGQSGVGIFDWKSGKKIYSSTAFQLNGYGHAEFYIDGDEEKPMADVGIEAAWGVHIHAADYDVYPLPYGPDKFDEFLAIRAAWDINTRAEGNWKVAGSGYVGLPVTHAMEATA